MRPSCARVMGLALLCFFLFSASSMAQRCKGKSSWPELVGKQGSTADAIIKAQNPNVDFVFPIEEGGVILNKKFDCRRVFVWVKPNGIIYRVPRVG